MQCRVMQNVNIYDDRRQRKQCKQMAKTKQKGKFPIPYFTVRCNHETDIIAIFVFNIAITSAGFGCTRTHFQAQMLKRSSSVNKK